jgi:hypothetical protein
LISPIGDSSNADAKTVTTTTSTSAGMIRRTRRA